jgi:hypothetical protein
MRSGLDDLEAIVNLRDELVKGIQFAFIVRTFTLMR